MCRQPRRLINLGCKPRTTGETSGTPTFLGQRMYPGISISGGILAQAAHAMPQTFLSTIGRTREVND